MRLGGVFLAGGICLAAYFFWLPGGVNHADAEALGGIDGTGEAALPTAPSSSERRDYFTYSTDPKYLEQKYLLSMYLYKKYKSPKAVKLAIAYATQLGKYDEAAKLMKELPDIGILKDNLETSILMKLLFNTSDLSFAELKQLKDFVNALYEQKKIDEPTYNMYYVIITLVKGDLQNTKFYIQKLPNTEYDGLYQRLMASAQLAESYPNAPESYLWGLRGVVLYQEGRRGPAAHIGRTLYKQDPTYLLAAQLVAYASMGLQDRPSAVNMLQHLAQTDDDYSDVYQFFQGIAHYFAGQYNESILLFKNVPESSTYARDVTRYLFQSYVAVGDYIHAGDTASVLLSRDDLRVEDLYTIFDTFLFQPRLQKKPFQLYEKFPELVESALSQCQHRFPDNGYVCLYGKAGRYLVEDDAKKAIPLLQRVIQRYPRSELYAYLGDLYTEQKQPTEAEKAYQQGFLLKSTEIDTNTIPRLE